MLRLKWEWVSFFGILQLNESKDTIVECLCDGFEDVIEGQLLKALILDRNSLIWVLK